MSPQAVFADALTYYNTHILPRKSKSTACEEANKHRVLATQTGNSHNNNNNNNSNFGKSNNYGNSNCDNYGNSNNNSNYNYNNWTTLRSYAILFLPQCNRSFN